MPGLSLLPPPLSLCSELSLPLPAVPCRSISVPGPPTLLMADTYAVVQKRGAPAGTGPGTRAPNSTDTPIYSQVAPRAQRPVAHTEDAQGTTALSRGELRPSRGAELRASTCSHIPRSPKAQKGLSGHAEASPPPTWPRPQALKFWGSSPKMSPRTQLGDWVLQARPPKTDLRNWPCPLPRLQPLPRKGNCV